ncbi:MAG TPA: hypothetical protein VES93_03575 [Ornithinibacter sp.]|nr:hypothetical protein [Ornithinibacter sp.]
MASTHSTPPRAVPEPHGEAARHDAVGRLVGLAPGIAVASIWVPTLLLSVFSPDMVTGSQQEHLPLGGLIAWLWAAAATGYVLMATHAREASDDPSRWVGFELSVLTIWAVVALAGIFAPVLVTGTDPTRIPLAALVAPVAGLVATGFVALHVTTSHR